MRDDLGKRYYLGTSLDWANVIIDGNIDENAELFDEDIRKNVIHFISIQLIFF